MDSAEYQRTQDALVLIAGIARDLDLDEFLARIDRAETLGPITDPTLYRDASGKLSFVRDLARSLKPFVAEVRRQTGGE